MPRLFAIYSNTRLENISNAISNERDAKNPILEKEKQFFQQWV